MRRNRAGESLGHDDRKFLEALHYFTVHSITWRALPGEYGKWNSVWQRVWRLIRSALEAARITPVIPRRETSKERGRFFPKRLYKLRARIEQTIGKLKQFKRVAMRCEKTDISSSAIVSFACGLMLVKSVHTA